MIIINPVAFLKYSEDLQSSQKVSQLVINYKTVLGSKRVELTPAIPEVKAVVNKKGEVTTEYAPAIEATYKDVPQGYIIPECTWNGQTVLDCTPIESETLEGNILGALHKMYLKQLQDLNNGVEFIDTYSE